MEIPYRLDQSWIPTLYEDMLISQSPILSPLPLISFIETALVIIDRVPRSHPTAALYVRPQSRQEEAQRLGESKKLQTRRSPVEATATLSLVPLLLP